MIGKRWIEYHIFTSNENVIKLIQDGMSAFIDTETEHCCIEKDENDRTLFVLNINSDGKRTTAKGDIDWLSGMVNAFGYRNFYIYQFGAIDSEIQ